MAGRRLDPEERALWRKVTATVRPLARSSAVQPPASDEAADAAVTHPPAAAAGAPGKRPAGRLPPPRTAPQAATTGSPRQAPSETLDGGWDRRLARGMVIPDIAIDLHGHTLATAHHALEAGLARALARDARLMLLVTGKPPSRRDDGAPRRGLIRAAVGDWLAASSHAGRIAAVRNAHPRHGGAGALYIILRRRRG